MGKIYFLDVEYKKQEGKRIVKSAIDWLILSSWKNKK